MSYILNALKKSEQERSGDKGNAAAARQPTVLCRPAPQEDSRTNWRLVAGGSLGVMGLIAVSVWAAGPWSEQTKEAGAPSSDHHPATAEAIATETASNPIKTSELPSGGAETASSTPAPANPDKTEAELEVADSVEEPSIGGQLARQRTPRAIAEAPSGTTRLVAMVLEPPARAPIPESSVEHVAAARPAVEVSDIPAPPGASVQQSDAAPTETAAAPAPSNTDAAAGETRISVAAATRAPADRLTLSEAADLHEKGWAHERSGDFDRAIVSFSRALELRPDFADAYFGRAWIHDRLDELDLAAADYGKAIQIEPKFAAAYSSRGVARFYLDELVNAEADFEKTMRLGRGELRRFAVLWRYLSSEQDGRDGAAQLAVDTANIKLDRWPGIIARFYLGEAGEEEVLRDTRDPDDTIARERLCVAYFFIAQKHLLDGSAAKARDYFQSALETGVTEFIQYKASQRELDRIARLR